MKEILVDNHDESRSRVESETPMEDLTMDQYTVEVCVLKLHPDRDVVHSLLTDKKGEVVKKEYGHCPTTFGNSIEIDIKDKSKSRFQEAVTGALKKGGLVKNRWTVTKSTVASTPATNREVDGRQKHY